MIQDNDNRFATFFYDWFVEHPEVRVLDEFDKEQKVTKRLLQIRGQNKKQIKGYCEPTNLFLSDE